MESEIIWEILKDNEKVFAIEEFEVLKRNIEVTKKIYMIGLIHGKQIYEKNSKKYI